MVLKTQKKVIKKVKLIKKIKNLMTANFPRLTVENVYHWYWENDPGLSLIDTAQLSEQVKDIGVDLSILFEPFSVGNDMKLDGGVPSTSNCLNVTYPSLLFSFHSSFELDGSIIKPM